MIKEEKAVIFSSWSTFAALISPLGMGLSDVNHPWKADKHEKAMTGYLH